MLFAKRLRRGIKEGRIVESIQPIALDNVTGELARRSGFMGVVDLLKVAKHGSGTNIYLIEFHYLPPQSG
jgi:hypothetical protein